MQIELTEEQAMIQQLARDFAEKEVRPIAEAIDRESRFPRETVARMGELGLMGIAVPRPTVAAAATRWPTPWPWRRWRGPVPPTP